MYLLGINSEEADAVRASMLAGDRSDMPGLVRISFGLYNTKDEIDVLIEALNCIARGEYRGKYTQNASTGEFHPQGWAPEFDKYFAL